MNYDLLNGQYLVRLWNGKVAVWSQIVYFEDSVNRHQIQFPAARVNTPITHVTIGSVAQCKFQKTSVLRAGDTAYFAPGALIAHFSLK